MDISLFNNSDFKNKDVRQDFLLINSLSHTQTAKVLDAMGHGMDSFPLQSLGDEKDWLETHNLVHQQELAYLGLKDMPNMADVDMNDSALWYDWLLQHSLIHQYTNLALGITP